MPRQVRLDDDVAILVADYQEAEGLKSLSASANRMLRLAAGPEPLPELEPDPPLPPERDTTVTVPRPRRRRRAGYPPTAPPPLRARAVAAGIEAGRRRVAAAAKKVGGCQHPILARRGDKCGACGQPVARA